MKDAVAGFRRDIERWKTALAAAEADGFNDLAEKIKGWIAEVERIITNAGY